MCTYCMIADWQFRHNPPWPPNQHPVWPITVPQPQLPGPIITPWPVDRVREFADLLRRVKELEDKLGCPCEPDKADYIKLLEERIRVLEARTDIAPPGAAIGG